MSKYGLVTQEDKWGCGVACLASLLGISYQDAKQLAEAAKERGVNARPSGLELHDLARALRGEGIKVVADWAPAAIPNGSIAFVAGGRRYGEAGHYILRTPRGWMDPWYNLRKVKNAEYREEIPKGTALRVVLVRVRG
jgi:hypothetical protein